jgi:hypothetical protein
MLAHERAASVENSPLFQYALMPTHLPHTFAVRELQDIQLQEPFSFAKGCRTMKISSGALHQSTQHEFGTLLFDLAVDYEQKALIENEEIHASMMKRLVQEMESADAPSKQFQRLGLS